MDAFVIVAGGHPIAATVDTLAQGIVVGRVINNAGAVGCGIAVVIKTLRVKEKNERVGRVGIVVDRKRLVLILLEELRVKRVPPLSKERVEASRSEPN